MTSTEHETSQAPTEGQDAPESAPEPPAGTVPPPEGSTTAAAAQAVGEATDREQPMGPIEALEALGEDVTSKTVVTTTPAGSLTLRPNQTELDDVQRAAMVAIGIDFRTDPGIIPHARAFVHMCQIRGLDPFAREAYLIGRGKGDRRKYTMQTGIDGYRKMGAATGRFIRVKKVLWTGSDDDDRSFERIRDEDGDLVMQRVWFDQWPAGRGNPGAAKVVIEHLTEDNEVTTTAAVADWGMYAPYNDVYEGTYPNKRKKIGADGKPVQELGEMWAKGGPHMLAKCAEALAYRKAFPAKMSGVYLTEELHRADAAERKRDQVDAGHARRKAFEAAQREQRTATPTVEEPKDVVDADVVDEPTTIADDVAAKVEETKPAVDDATLLGWLCAEFDYQAETVGQKPTMLAKRNIAKHRKNLDDFGVEEMQSMVVNFRGMVLSALQGKGATEEIDMAYRNAAADNDQPIDWDTLVGNGVVDAEVVPDPEPADPDAPHLYVEADGGGCWQCGLPKDVGPHVDEIGDRL